MSPSTAGSPVQTLLETALELEGKIISAGLSIRGQSKTAYHQGLLDARLVLVGGLAHVLSVRSGVPGESNESVSHRLVLLASFVQGIHPTESLISEGQYIKAAAVLKQDYEILARLGEVLEGTAVAGQTPNARAAPRGSQRLYGELNKVAHPSNKHLMEQLLGRLSAGEVQGISPFPVFNRGVACSLYELHVFTLMYALRAAVVLFLEMYPKDKDAVLPAVQAFVTGVEFAKQAGFVVE